MRNSELFLIRAFVTKYPNSVGADSISARYTPVFYTKHHLKFGKNQADNLAYIGFRCRFFPVFYWCLVLLVFSITINERPYFHRIKPLKIGTFLLKNCMPKIAVTIRDRRPVPYRNFA